MNSCFVRDGSFRVLQVGAACLALALNAGFAEGLKELKRDAEHGDARAQYSLGRRYEQGDGVRENVLKATKWYSKAAAQGSAPAQYSLGRLYAAGLGVRQDYAEALKWFRRAAAQDYSLAQNRLGVMYEKGQGVTQNYIEAYKWYALAAGENGNVFGIANREALSHRMTAEEIAEGERWARADHVLTLADTD